MKSMLTILLSMTLLQAAEEPANRTWNPGARRHWEGNVSVDLLPAAPLRTKLVGMKEVAIPPTGPPAMVVWTQEGREQKLEVPLPGGHLTYARGEIWYAVADHRKGCLRVFQVVDRNAWKELKSLTTTEGHPVNLFALGANNFQVNISQTGKAQRLRRFRLTAQGDWSQEENPQSRKKTQSSYYLDDMDRLLGDYVLFRNQSDKGFIYVLSLPTLEFMWKACPPFGISKDPNWEPPAPKVRVSNPFWRKEVLGFNSSVNMTIWWAENPDGSILVATRSKAYWERSPIAMVPAIMVLPDPDKVVKDGFGTVFYGGSPVFLVRDKLTPAVELSNREWRAHLFDRPEILWWIVDLKLASCRQISAPQGAPTRFEANMPYFEFVVELDGRVKVVRSKANEWN